MLGNQGRQQTKMKRGLINTDDFEALRRQGGCYVDKTRFIPDFFKWSFVKLMTRPRNFGKSLTLSMLQAFLEMNYQDPENKSRQLELFVGLDIVENEAFVRENMGAWPVIRFSFKNVNGPDFETAVHKMFAEAQALCRRFEFLLGDPNLAIPVRDTLQGVIEMADDDAEKMVHLLIPLIYCLEDALFGFCGKRAIVLIDDYEAPVVKAREHGYYEAMLYLVRGMLGWALKSSPYLNGAVMMGCSRQHDESIYIGPNNIVHYDVSSELKSEVVGFTRDELEALLRDLGAESLVEKAATHCGGHCFGRTKMYCPGDLAQWLCGLPAEPFH